MRYFRTKWTEYTGSDEQIAEINKSFSEYGVLFKLDTGNDTEPYYSFTKRIFTQYLICNPHPLAGMICQQARTGQPVWVKVDRDSCGNKINMIYTTTTPDWNIPNAEYSFIEFEKSVDK